MLLAFSLLILNCQSETVDKTNQNFKRYFFLSLAISKDTMQSGENTVFTQRENKLVQKPT